MAKASVSIKCEGCGESFVHERICRNRAGADSYEAWASEHITLCWRCLRAEREASEARKAAEIVGGRVLPELEGSEKQIAWALKIREKAIFRRFEDSQYFADMYECSREKIDEWADRVRKEYDSKDAEYAISVYVRDWTIVHGTSAKWLIDNRNNL